MGFRVIVGVAVAALLLCGVSFAAPAAGGVGGETGSDDVARASDELHVGVVELAAVPAESRALFAKVLGRLDGMRGQLEELKADKARSDERAESMRVRITKLEEKSKSDCEDTREDLEMGTDEPEVYTQPMLETRRRIQAAPQACARVQDFQALSAAAMDACCPASGGGHRRLQASCDLPAACPSAACAAVFVPYMQDCAAMLAATPGVPVADFESFAASCAELQAGGGEMLQPVAVQMFRVLVNTEAAAQAGSMFPGGGGSGDGGGKLDPLQPLPPVPPPPPDATGGGDETADVTQYHAVCTSVDIASCVPPCNAEHHGFELLATIDGTDTKFSCNLAHGLFSWMGAASEGGYLGADAQSFFSAVVSGAAGSYIVTLTADADIHTELVIRPGQNVRISSDPGLVVPLSWGSGGFTVAERGSLSLTGVAVSGAVAVQRDGALHLTQVPFVGHTYDVFLAEGSIFTQMDGTNPFGSQCSEPYTILSDEWRSTSMGNGAPNQHTDCSDHGTGVGGGRWYRFASAGGNALPLTNPEYQHCSTDLGGWLSGWAGDGAPPSTYNIAGRYPIAAEGVVEMTVCFDNSVAPCGQHVVIGVVQCGGFLLWRLPDSPNCPNNAVYCTTPNGRW
jgi:hypothetical protein